MRCAATGMRASVDFLPGGAAVRGAVSRLQGQGTVKIATINGSWADTVEVTAPDWEASGEGPPGIAVEKAVLLCLPADLERCIKPRPPIRTNSAGLYGWHIYVPRTQTANTVTKAVGGVQAFCSMERRLGRRPCALCACKGSSPCGCRMSGAPSVTACSVPPPACPLIRLVC